MDRWVLIVAVAAVTYATRIAGFSLGKRAVPDAVNRFLMDVPVAVFAALIVPGLGLTGDKPWPRLLGAGLAALVVSRTGKLWAALAAGMAAYWLIQAVG